MSALFAFHQQVGRFAFGTSVPESQGLILHTQRWVQNKALLKTARGNFVGRVKDSSRTCPRLMSQLVFVILVSSC